MRLADIRIRSKLSFTIAFTLFFFMVVTVSYTLILHRCLSQNQALRDREFQIQQLAADVALSMLQARRGEKDFLLFRDESHVGRVAAATREAMQRGNTLLQLSREAGHPDVEAKVMQILQAMEAYLQAFQALAEGHVAVGLTEEQGLQGRLRQNAHPLEAMLRQRAPERMVDYLALRRAEKDYLLRHDMRDATTLRMLLHPLQEALSAPGLGEGEREEAGRLLTDYAQAFDALLAQEQKNAVSLATLRGAVHQVEPLSDEIRQLSQATASRVASETQAFGERSSVLLLLFSLLTVAVCGVVCAAVIRSISRSLGALQHFSREISAGHWDALIPVEGGDEMGQLAEVMRSMVSRVHGTRLLSDRLLLIMVLIGRGIIPGKVEGEAQGEFQQVSVALNGMIETLSTIRLVTQRLEQLGQGIVPDKLDEGHREGEFKQMLVAVNRLLDRQSGVRSA
ncbi:MAG: HAMP domain-containing protein [Magnetococcus sp. XQGC-1]